MWRRTLASRCIRTLASRCILLFNRSFTRQSLVTRFDNPVTTSQSQVIIHKALNTNNNNNISSSYYHSVLSPMQHEFKFQRFMSNNYTCGSNNENKIVVDENHEEPIDEEEVNNLLSVMNHGCIDTIVECGEYRDTLLNHSFFLRMIDDPPEEMPDDNYEGYLIWVFGRDDFKMTKSLLSKIMDVFAAPCVMQNGGEEFLYDVVWNMMQRRKVVFKKEGIVTTKLLNKMLFGFALSLLRSNTSLTAIQILDMFEEFGCVPDIDSYYWTAANCRKLKEEDPRDSRICQNIVHLVRTQPVEESLVNWLINSYCSMRKLKFAHAVYVAAKEKNPPPLVCVFHLIRLLSHKDETLCLAVDMLADLSSDARGSKGSAAAFSSVVTGLCRKNDVHGARKLMAEMILKGPPPGIKAFNALIKSLCLTGDLEDAFEMLKITQSRGLKPDLGTYRLVIKGYQKRGMMEQACKVLSMATEKHPTSTMKVQLA